MTTRERRRALDEVVQLDEDVRRCGGAHARRHVHRRRHSLELDASDL